jgi:hypothetical protein
MDVQELRPGLWRWTAPHPAWRPNSSWPRDVACTYAETDDAIVLIDPLVPTGHEEAAGFWRALDRDRDRNAERTVTILLTARWHRRSADAISQRCGAAVWSPGAPLPDGVVADVFEDGEWREVVFSLPAYAALVFGDVIEGDGRGGLRMPPDWWPPDMPRTARVRSELARLLRGPIELVLVSHGEPVLEDGAAALRKAIAT